MLWLMELMLRITWKFLVLFFVFSLCTGLMKNGKGTIRELQEAIVMGFKVVTRKLKGWLFEKYMEQNRPAAEEATKEL